MATKPSSNTILAVYNVFDEQGTFDLNITADSPGAALDRAIEIRQLDINDLVLKITQTSSVYV